MKNWWALSIIMCGMALATGCSRPAAPGDAAHLQVVLTAVGDSADINTPYSAAGAPDGGLFVSTQAATGLIAELDSTGHLKRTFGHLGQGPGEYEKPGLLLATRDRVVIGDFLGNIHFFAMSGKFDHTIGTSVQGATRGLLLRGDTMVLMQRANGKANVGVPLHLIAPNGHIIKSFGAVPGTDDPNRFMQFNRVVAIESDSSFWVGHMAEYSIELWTSAGMMVRRLELTRPWFPPLTTSIGAINSERPAALLLALHKDAHGHLMVLLRKARPDWSPKPMAILRAPMAPSAAMDFIEEVIEVIDPVKGALIASVVVKTSPVLMFLADDRLFGVIEDKDGRQMPVLWKLVH